jgi:fructose-bisphosphate aldolase class II
MTAAGLAPDGVRARTTRARGLMQRTRVDRFAVGAFNADNVETLRAICRAAKACNAPALVELSHAEVAAIGLANARSVLDNEIDDLGVEVYLNLDHAPTLEAAVEAVDAGFEFVHLDCFQNDPGANEHDITATTRELVVYARSTGAVVEGEMQHFHGSSTLHREPVELVDTADALSTPEAARRFVDRTGIDTFAVAIGNVHGRYPTRQRLRFDILSRVRDAIDVNISVHGGSSTTNTAYRTLARRGVSKINVNSDIRYAYRSMLEYQLAAHRDEYATAKLIGPVVDAVQRVIEQKMCAFGSAGRAITSTASTAGTSGNGAP